MSAQSSSAQGLGNSERQDAPQHHWHGVLDSAMDAVGHTPLIRLQTIAREEGFKCNLMGKCEFFSAGGSVKDRIAKRMVEQAERDGKLVKGQSVVIEPTSGNTGIGLALACAIKGYKCIITLPAKMSLEKEVMLRALGAEIVRTPTEAAWDSPESHIGVAKKLRDSIPHAIILDQYANPHNPLAHYYTTYKEIEYALQTSSLPRKDISVLVAGAGTGGTITGISRGIRDAQKEGDARTTVVAVDPVGSILGGGEPGNYQVEGIGYDFFPEVLDPKPPTVDRWIKTEDGEAFAATKRLIRSEGLFIGGSSGSALSGAIRYLHSADGQAVAKDPEANVVVILPDGVRNYMSKPWFLDVAADASMKELRDHIRGVLGRELNAPDAVVAQAESQGASLEKGEGVDHTSSPEGTEATLVEQTSNQKSIDDPSVPTQEAHSVQA
ncbi:tryptophan synthase beta subunit-like PLP-dependent enzyme [Kockovaella imperatae]|uniref:cystathionine beta-synthase n=1 Tax=Kockovaella imperatae TaxID=4999 RepID=A0A1Y1UV16_9TREE|nr:tryptophan synthase beta subunit-like PLP-dependent enzyme [Kockovaella imperatae]ORX41055.1 tryptophan synthase beta subunit-like PLP-dependent enzyme [Kockovaella imperatae]